MTYEKFTALVLGSPHILDQVATIVVDEVQMIADISRGVNLEFLLTLLRMRRRQGAEPQIIALSAVIGDTNGLERWLEARILRRIERPVPLDEGVIRADGSFRFISSDTGEEQIIKSFIKPEFRKGSSQDYIIPLVRKLIGESKSVIVFRETRGEARGCALYLASSVGLPSVQGALDRLPMGDPSTASGRLREALEGGIAFHISDLDPEERQVVEEEFRAKDSTLKVIAATTTLAMGVNTPAEAVIIAGLMHPDKNPYSVAEYKNIAGRAGRLGMAERGTSYLIIRLVNAFGTVTPESINDPALIAATQLTVELDDVLFPINKRSTQKEPQTWTAEIQRQGVPNGILRAMQRSVREENQPTLRAKKAVACLLWITDRPLAQIEEILTQFGRKFDGAAGPVRSVRARTCDILPMVARVAEIL